MHFRGKGWTLLISGGLIDRLHIAEQTVKGTFVSRGAFNVERDGAAKVTLMLSMRKDVQ